MRALWTVGMLVALLVVGGGATRVAAQAQTTEATGYEVTCSIQPGSEWLSGDILHIRGEVATTRTVASNLQTGKAEPRLIGTNTILLNIDVNTATGRGTLHGSTTFQPDGIAGTWETRFTGTIRDGIVAVHAVGHGTGELAGMKLRAELQSIDLADAPAICGSAGLAASTVSWELRP